ncbi:MAG: 4Fe-4S dicluster domain-containing protein [Acidobacteria bacterium]|nr:4Fe-4S dicluster domain-containing protein [Acidobacteriota bacterium]
MSEEKWKEAITPPKKLSLEDRLYLVKRKLDKISHIEVDQEAFKRAKDPAILYICPAKVYERNEETGECIVNFENCLECGTCQVACPDIVRWKNPMGGFGVSYRYS